MISIDSRDPRPLYEQVVDGFRRLIVSGALRPDDRLPSVRSLATQLAINPNTIQRAYRELEQEGCISSVRGKGSFVADVSGAAEARRRELLEQFDQLVQELGSLGVTSEELGRRVGGGEG